MPKKIVVPEKKVLKALTFVETKRTTYRGVKLIHSTNERRPGAVTISTEASPLFTVTGANEADAIKRAKTCVDNFFLLKEQDAAKKVAKKK